MHHLIPPVPNKALHAANSSSPPLLQVSPPLQGGESSRFARRWALATAHGWQAYTSFSSNDSRVRLWRGLVHSNTHLSLLRHLCKLFCNIQESVVTEQTLPWWSWKPTTNIYISVLSPVLSGRGNGHFRYFSYSGPASRGPVAQSENRKPRVGSNRRMKDKPF